VFDSNLIEQKKEKHYQIAIEAD